MEQESGTTSGTKSPALIHPNLEPMYELSDQDYHAIINQLTNVLLDTVGRLQAADNADEARFTAEQAYEILLDYDDDVAEHVRYLAQEEGGYEQTRSTEEVTW